MQVKKRLQPQACCRWFLLFGVRFFLFLWGVEHVTVLCLECIQPIRGQWQMRGNVHQNSRKPQLLVRNLQTQGQLQEGQTLLIQQFEFYCRKMYRIILMDTVICMKYCASRHPTKVGQQGVLTPTTPQHTQCSFHSAKFFYCPFIHYIANHLTSPARIVFLSFRSLPH